MSATVSFDNLERGWIHRRGTFEGIFTIAIGQFADVRKIPGAWNILKHICAEMLSEAWPERFSLEDEGAPPFFTFTDLPRSEQEELSRCVRAAADALRDGTADKRVPINWDHVDVFAQSAKELSDCMAVSLSLSAKPSGTGIR
jgi:hypothetical protein